MAQNVHLIPSAIPEASVDGANAARATATYGARPPLRARVTQAGTGLTRSITMQVINQKQQACEGRFLVGITISAEGEADTPTVTATSGQIMDVLTDCLGWLCLTDEAGKVTLEVTQASEWFTLLPWATSISPWDGDNGLTDGDIPEGLDLLDPEPIPPPDHGTLSGLADDDHTQYHNDTRGDARYSLLAHTHSTIVLSLGAVGTPSATFTGDTNTGLYSAGADSIDVAAGGSRILSCTLTTGDKITTVYGQPGAYGTIPGFGYRNAPGFDLTQPCLKVDDGTSIMYLQGNEVLTSSSQFRIKIYNGGSSGGTFFVHANSGGEFDPIFMANTTGNGVGTVAPNAAFSARFGTIGGIQLHTRQLSAAAGLCGLFMKYAGSESTWLGNHGMAYVPNGTAAGDEHFGKIHISARNVNDKTASLGSSATQFATYAVVTVDNTSTLGAPNVGIATVSPTGRLHLPAGAAGVSRAPLKLTTGTVLTTPEAGAVEFTDPYLYFTGNTTIGRGSAHVRTSSTSASLGASQNDYAIAAGITFHRITASTPINVTGIASGIDSRELTICNVGANAITLKHQDAASTAANRLLSQTGADVVLAADAIARLIYDATTQRWRI